MAPAAGARPLETFDHEIEHLLGQSRQAEEPLATRFDRPFKRDRAGNELRPASLEAQKIVRDEIGSRFDQAQREIGFPTAGSAAQE